MVTPKEENVTGVPTPPLQELREAESAKWPQEPSPVFALIEPTDVCNLACPMCSREEVLKKSGKAPSSLGLESLEHIARHIPTLKEIKFHGLGEPFLTRNAPKIFSRLKELWPGVHVVTITNVTWPDFVDVQAILRSVDHVYVSIDGHDRETFETYRLKGKFDRMVHNVRRIMREKPDSTKVSVNCCFTKETYRNLYQMVILTRALGVDTIRFNLVQNWIPEVDEEKAEKHDEIRAKLLHHIDLDDLVESVRYMKRIAEMLGVSADIVGNPDFEPKTCNWSTKMTYVTVAGEVLPCCMRCDTKYSFGNVFKTPFEAIWKGSELNRFREQLRSDNPPKICKDCPYLLNAKILRYINERVAATKSDFLMHI